MSEQDAHWVFSTQVLGLPVEWVMIWTAALGLGAAWKGEQVGIEWLALFGLSVAAVSIPISGLVATTRLAASRSEVTEDA